MERPFFEESSAPSQQTLAKNCWPATSGHFPSGLGSVTSAQNGRFSDVLRRSRRGFGSIGVLFDFEPTGVTHEAWANFNVRFAVSMPHVFPNPTRFGHCLARVIFIASESLWAKQSVSTAGISLVNPCWYHHFHNREHRYSAIRPVSPSGYPTRPLTFLAWNQPFGKHEVLRVERVEIDLFTIATSVPLCQLECDFVVFRQAILLACVLLEQASSELHLSRPLLVSLGEVRSSNITGLRRPCFQ